MDLQWLIENADKLSTVGILFVVVGGLTWVIKLLYGEKSACEADRLETAQVVGELRKDVSVMKTKIEVHREEQREHRAEMTRLHTGVLTMVANKPNE